MVRKTEGWEKINWIELLKPDYRKIILSFVLTILILAITSYWNYTSCLNRIRLVKSMGYDIGHCQFNLNPFETSFVSEVQFPPDFPYISETESLFKTRMIEKVILLIFGLYILSAYTISYIDSNRHKKSKLKTI